MYRHSLNLALKKDPSCINLACLFVGQTIDGDIANNDRRRRRELTDLPNY